MLYNSNIIVKPEDDIYQNHLLIQAGFCETRVTFEDFYYPQDK
jgi:hypothetical protein